MVTISDLFKASGTQILAHIWTCTRPAWFDPNQIVTLQKRPSAYQIKHRWQKFLLNWCTHSGYSLPATDLGRWLLPTDQLHLHRESYFVPGPFPTSFHWRDGCYWEYCPTPTNNYCFSPNRATSWSPTPAAVPVDLHISIDDSPKQVRAGTLVKKMSAALARVKHDET